MAELLEQNPDEANGGIDAAAASMVKLKRVLKLINVKDYSAAKERMDEIPVDFHTSRIFRSTKIRLAAAMNDTSTLYPEVRSYEADFPDAQEINFIMIDVCFNNLDYEGALTAINRLDKYIDNDPLQDYYRGLAYKMEGKMDSTTACFERVYKGVPDISSSYAELMIIYLKNGRIADAQKIIKQYKENKSFDQSLFTVLISNYPQFAEFF